MKTKLGNLWAKSGSIVVADLGNDFFSVKFSSLEDLNLALTGGPWILMGHYLAIRKWESFFNPHKANIHRVAAWIRLPGIPQEFCVAPFLKLIGNTIGKVLKVDRTTSMGDRGKFARLCVDLDLTKPLRGEYILEDEVFKVEYEGLYLICIRCGKYGHNTDKCPDFVKTDEANINKETSHPDSANTQANQGVGPWMVVQKKKFFRNQSPRKNEVKGERSFGVDISNSKKPLSPQVAGISILKNPGLEQATAVKKGILKENKRNPLSQVTSKATNSKASTGSAANPNKTSSKPLELPSSSKSTSKGEFRYVPISPPEPVISIGKDIDPEDPEGDLCTKISAASIISIDSTLPICVFCEVDDKPLDMDTNMFNGAQSL
ncbi:uncharacterized protein LOC133306243 [Gastrolobium bilobum]|uniref:uncharacterized protein LOC133306243 n=1 Tax=Gastrolobium bilobum TaxID=150636 RepID=UPI002AB15C40|nr:uncharacterized protein LOC133306243 [Gastrolobium bilobum]